MTKVSFQERGGLEAGFATHFQEYIHRQLTFLDLRRRRFAAFFWPAVIAGALLLIASPYLTYLIVHWMAGYSDTNSHLTPFNTFEYVSTSIILWGALVIVAARLATWPMLSYRRELRKITMPNAKESFEQVITLKELLFNTVFDFFGPFRFHPEGGVSPREMRASRILPEHRDYFAEDRVTGTYQDMKVELCEAVLINESRDKALFKGLIILLDVTQDPKIARPFEGVTVVIKDQDKDRVETRARLKDLERFPLPGPGLEAELEAFTSHPEEAGELITGDMLASLQELQRRLNAAETQRLHPDKRLYYFTQRLATVLGDAFMDLMFFFGNLVSFVWRRSWMRPSRLDSKQPGFFQRMALEHDMYLQQEYPAINDSIQCSFYGSKVLMTVPCRHNLFEPDSLFAPPLNEEDIHLIFGIMQVVTKVADVIHRRTPRDFA